MMIKDDTPDYHFICNKDTPKEERDRLFIGKWYNNSVKCLKCGDVIRSKNKHHYNRCSCGTIAVDGGSHYLKRVGDLTMYEDLSEEFNDATDE